jgi:hypothetical protein
MISVKIKPSSQKSAPSPRIQPHKSTSKLIFYRFICGHWSLKGKVLITKIAQ